MDEYDVFYGFVFLIFLLLETFRFQNSARFFFFSLLFLPFPFLRCISKQVSQFFWRRKQERERSAGIRMSLRSEEGEGRMKARRAFKACKTVYSVKPCARTLHVRNTHTSITCRAYCSRQVFRPRLRAST